MIESQISNLKSQIIIGDSADINCGLCLAAMNRDGWGTKLFTPAQQALIAAQMSLVTEGYSLGRDARD